MSDDDSQSKDDARSFLEHIEDCAKESLKPENTNILAPDERAELEWSLKHLRSSFDELSKWFVEPLREGKPSMCSYGYDRLWSLMAAAFIAGSRGTVTESARNFLKPEIIDEAQDSQAASARAAKAEADEARKVELLKAIRDHVKDSGLTLAASIEFADRIRPSVRKLLDLPKDGAGYPSAGTIKAAISEIKSARA